jgi:hypothetical protein
MSKEIKIVVTAANKTKEGLNAAAASVKKLGGVVNTLRMGFNLFTSAAFGTGFAIGKWLDDKLKISDKIANMIAPVRNLGKALSTVASESEKAARAKFDGLIGELEKLSKAGERGIGIAEKKGDIAKGRRGAAGTEAEAAIEARTDLTQEQKSVELAKLAAEQSNDDFETTRKTASAKTDILKTERETLAAKLKQAKAAPAEIWETIERMKAAGVEQSKLSALRGEWSAAVADLAKVEEPWTQRLEDIDLEMQSIAKDAEIAAAAVKKAESGVTVATNAESEAVSKKKLEDDEKRKDLMEEITDKTRELAKAEAEDKRIENTERWAESLEKAKTAAEEIDEALAKRREMGAVGSEKWLDNMRDAEKHAREIAKLQTLRQGVGLGAIPDEAAKKLSGADIKAQMETAKLMKRIGATGPQGDLGKTSEQILADAKKAGVHVSRKQMEYLKQNDMIVAGIREREKAAIDAQNLAESQKKDKEADVAYRQEHLRLLAEQITKQDTLLRAAH